MYFLSNAPLLSRNFFFQKHVKYFRVQTFEWKCTYKLHMRLLFLHDYISLMIKNSMYRHHWQSADT